MSIDIGPVDLGRAELLLKLVKRECNDLKIIKRSLFGDELQQAKTQLNHANILHDQLIDAIAGDTWATAEGWEGGKA